jgi:hypothetical protein
VNPTSSEDLRKIPVSYQGVTRSPESKPGFSLAYSPHASVSLNTSVAETTVVCVVVWGERRKSN